MKITSTTNQLIKDTAKLLQKKYRMQSGLFILEGFKVIKEAFDNGIQIDKVFIDEKHLQSYSFLDKNIQYEVNENILKKISSTETPPEAVAIAKQISFDKNNLKSYKKVLLLENIKDTGNLGTIIRSAVAFETDAIILFGKECVDLYNPKCVRATVGNLWKIPVFYMSDIYELNEYFSKFTRVATLPRSKNYLKSSEFKKPILLMFGSEADGLSDDLIKFSNTDVKIEMKETVESLNLATSVSILLYEIN